MFQLSLNFFEELGLFLWFLLYLLDPDTHYASSMQIRIQKVSQKVDSCGSVFFHDEYIVLKAMVENDINDNSTANLSIKKFNDWENKQPEITYTEPVSNRK